MCETADKKTFGCHSNVRALGRVSYIDYIENLNISTETLLNEKLSGQV